MDLGTFFKKQDKDAPEYFWSLVIGKSWVEAAIWRVVGEKTEVLTEGSGASWQEDNEETLIQAADSVLSAVAASFEDEEKEPNKVVFGLSPSWVEEGNIKAEGLRLLKKLSEELELSPAGFVVLPEALVHFLKSREGAPPNAILVGVLEDEIELSLVQNGKVTGTVEVARSISLGADVAEGLARFSGVDQHPSRIVLYNHRVADLEEARQSLLDTGWQELKINFLHTPKVEILEENALVSAVSLGGGAEIGEAKSVELVGEEEPVGADLVSARPEEAEVKEPELREATPEELGFVKGDVAQKQEEKPVPQEKPKRTLPSLKLPSLPSFSFRPARGPTLGVVLFLFLALLVGAGLSWWYLPRARVTIFVAPKTLEKTLSMSVDGDIPANAREVEVNGEKTRAATGTKTVGDKSGGEVTVFRVGPAITLDSGIVLAGPNGLKFTLNEDVKVASGSSIVSPSQTPAVVTAVDIGAQYNLAGGTEFSVGNFSKGDLVAKNENALSGGSSREIAAVSEEDRKSLEEELADELKSQGLDKIKANLLGGEVLLEGSQTFTVNERSFSHKVGEEADTLKLAMRGSVLALVAPKDALSSYIMSQLEKDISEGFALRPEQIRTSFSKVEDEEDEFTARVTANLLPRVAPDEIAKSIAGKYPTVAKESLASIPGFTRAEISLSIRLPGRLGTLPRLARNITIEVEAER